MSCPRLEHEVAAYLDSELDLASTLAFERHLGECAECARALAAEEALREAIGRAGLRFQLPPEQARRLRRANAANAARRRQRASAGRSTASPQRPAWRLQAAAALLLVAIASWSLGRFGAPRPGPRVMSPTSPKRW